MNDLSIIVSHDVSDRRYDDYGAIAACVLVTDRLGVVCYANGLAHNTLSGQPLVEQTISALMTTAGAIGSEPLVHAVRSGTEAAGVHVNLPNGRIFDGHCRPLEHDRLLVTLFEVTGYVKNAKMALRDPLTGLANRAGLDEQLRTRLVQTRREGRAVAVFYIDLDKFKLVNDTLGHPVGDALLVKVAQRLRSATRGDDLVARLGGDEFAILQVGDGQPQTAEALATRLVDLIGRTYIAAGHMVSVGASIGIAIAPHDGDDSATLQKRADLALYRAKAEGRGQFRFYEPGMDDALQSRRLMEIDLRKALALQEFELFYQPQMDLESNRLVGFEALLRWRSPARGLVSPSVFIPLAEEIGLIGRIGEWVLRTACREAASWKLPVSVSVNVSSIQFRNVGLAQAVNAALSQSGLPPQRLELEITESALLDDTDTTLQILRDIRALGVRISMDDFGTGYSSLNYLQRFPFDKIKIDRSFVQKADRTVESTAILRAVAALGISLGMTTIAEGVETQEQLASVRAEGCHVVQGYLTGRPMPAHEAAALLTNIPLP